MQTRIYAYLLLKVSILYHKLKWFYVSCNKKDWNPRKRCHLCTQGTENSLNLKVIFPIILQEQTKVVNRFPWSTHEPQGRIMELYSALNFTKSAWTTDFYQRTNPYLQCVPKYTLQECLANTGEEEGNIIPQSHSFEGLACKPSLPVNSNSNLGYRTGKEPETQAGYLPCASIPL